MRQCGWMCHSDISSFKEWDEAGGLGVAECATDIQSVQVVSLVVVVVLVSRMPSHVVACSTYVCILDHCMGSPISVADNIAKQEGKLWARPELPRLACVASCARELNKTALG